jgi:hypothetical protein
MKRLAFIFLILLNSVLVLGQQVSSPEPKSFVRSTNGQDASGFSLSGFNSTATLLCAIGLPQAPSGTTFYLTTTSGLTPATGYTMIGNKTRLAFTGTMANINAALATLKINTTATSGNIQISVSATVNPTGYFYLPTNGHFYRPISGFTGVTAFSGTSPTAYNNLKTYCTQQTFKGQTGYLMTITSADEDNFVINNVPGNNIIFALTDNVTEGTFKIDAGPEAGTTVRIGATNQQGQYNNWAGGEPNNWGPGEDYVVTKWNGSQWNDFGPEATAFPGGLGGYVIEFGTWTNPDDQTFTEFYSNSVIHSNGDVFRVQYTFNFSNLIASRFGVRSHSQSNGVWSPFSQTYTTLNNIGRADLSSQSDTVKIQDGIKASISVGQAEFSYVNISNGTTTLYIDLTRFGNTQPSSVKNVSILDVYSGPVTYQQTSTYWAHYIVPSTLPKVTDGSSSFNSSIRNAGYNNWAFMSNISFFNNMIYKSQKVQFQGPISDTVISMLDRIVTVSDVYLAFKEFADGGGIFGGGSGTQMTSGIQFMNADVNGDGQFNESDCFKLLKHLLGQESLLTQNDLNSFMKILPKGDYDAVTKSNWGTYPNTTSDSYDNISLSSTQLLNAFTMNVFWKGDVNMSHSPAQSGSGSVANQSLSLASSMVKNMSISGDLPSAYIISQISNDSLIAVIKFNAKSNSIVGTQFRINYDNSRIKYVNTDFKLKGSPTNFGTNKGSYINLGSLVTNGELLDPSAEYKIIFKLNTNITNSLGLISIASNEAVNQNGESIKIKIE